MTGDRTSAVAAARMYPSTPSGLDAGMNEVFQNSPVRFNSGSLEHELRISAGFFEAARAKLRSVLGSSTESVDIFDGLRERQVTPIKNALSTLVNRLLEGPENKSLARSIAGGIKGDVFDYQPELMKAFDSTDAAHLRGFEQFLAPDAAVDTDVLTDAVAIAALNAQYKFLKYGYPTQMQDLIEMTAKIIRTHPDAKECRVALLGVSETVIKAWAALEIDFESKPNYQYARRDLVQRLADCRQMNQDLCAIFSA